MQDTTIAKNRKAFHEYEIMESFEAGISLTGTEVKSLRAGKIQITEGWIDFSKAGEAWMMQVNISPYVHGNINNHEATRARKLLLRKRQIEDLGNKVLAKGCTCIPLSIYMKKRWVKVQIALVRGKKQYDKRRTEKEKDMRKEIQIMKRIGS